MTENERFLAVFAKTGFINSGTYGLKMSAYPSRAVCHLEPCDVMCFETFVIHHTALDSLLLLGI
jgi:hypothetical protein